MILTSYGCSSSIATDTSQNSGARLGPGITYSSDSYSFSVNVAISTITPTITGTPFTNCTSSPTLPSGLVIDASTCAISGTATTSQVATAYTITATNEIGDGTTSINIIVNGLAPTVSYSGSPYSWEQNDATSLTATLGGGAPSSCTATPTLPAGLSISATSCGISGTPTATQGVTAYTITATNSFGNDTANINISIVADGTAPTVSSSTPSDTATGVAPNSGTDYHCLCDAMNTALNPTLTTEAWNGSAYVAIPNTGTTFSWTNATTLTITLSWVQYPENTKIQWTLAAANLKDNSANVIAGDVVRTFTTTSRNTYFPIADTGQTLCYNATTTLTCGDASFPRQDGDNVNIPNARSFTGPTQHATHTSDYTTKDNVTGLVWKTCIEGKSGATCATGSASTMFWYNAVNQCAALNTANSGAGYAGSKTWRLPTTSELDSLLNYGTNDPTINAIAFPATDISIYWSATSSAPSPTAAYYVRFLSGIEVATIKTGIFSLRCVTSEL